MAKIPLSSQGSASQGGNYGAGGGTGRIRLSVPGGAGAGRTSITKPGVEIDAGAATAGLRAKAQAYANIGNAFDQALSSVGGRLQKLETQRQARIGGNALREAEHMYIRALDTFRARPVGTARNLAQSWDGQGHEAVAGQIRERFKDMPHLMPDIERMLEYQRTSAFTDLNRQSLQLQDKMAFASNQAQINEALAANDHRRALELVNKMEAETALLPEQAEQMREKIGKAQKEFGRIKEIETDPWAAEEKLRTWEAEMDAFEKEQANVSGDSVGFVDWVKEFEGYNEESYWDYKQWSIGHGTKAGGKGERITKEEAEKQLVTELDQARSEVESVAKEGGYEFKEHHLQALTSFQYNTGSVRQLLIENGSRSLDEINDAMLKYNKAGGEVLPGLTKRRGAEVEVFNGLTDLRGAKAAPHSREKLASYRKIQQAAKAKHMLDASQEWAEILEDAQERGEGVMRDSGVSAIKAGLLMTDDYDETITALANDYRLPAETMRMIHEQIQGRPLGWDSYESVLRNIRLYQPQPGTYPGQVDQMGARIQAQINTITNDSLKRRAQSLFDGKTGDRRGRLLKQAEGMIRGGYKVNSFEDLDTPQTMQQIHSLVDEVAEYLYDTNPESTEEEFDAFVEKLLKREGKWSDDINSVSAEVEAAEREGRQPRIPMSDQALNQRRRTSLSTGEMFEGNAEEKAEAERRIREAQNSDYDNWLSQQDSP